jgi:hypothetical protein
MPVLVGIMIVIMIGFGVPVPVGIMIVVMVGRGMTVPVSICVFVFVVVAVQGAMPFSVVISVEVFVFVLVAIELTRAALIFFHFMAGGIARRQESQAPDRAPAFRAQVLSTCLPRNQLRLQKATLRQLKAGGNISSWRLLFVSDCREKATF